ncbi:hypothetical protein [Aquisalimonas sp.]|uniref:ImmA/IrrE family metallo-endopeptidase n=1 Tax=Aquisalimonas sp. TaxID=1872621 RepID=UPI0025C1AF06|nr:hypothetical protein [Aquisalimonas sp.]
MVFFRHEAGHLARHSKRIAFVDVEGGLDDTAEAEANAFARDQVMPPELFAELEGTTLTTSAVRWCTLQ